MTPRPPTNPDCPVCIEGKLIWSQSAAVWTCNSNICEHEQDFVHWLTPGATRRLHIQPDAFGDNPEYEEIWDNQTAKNWLMRTVNPRKIATRHSRRPGVYQVAYSNLQYDLVGWSLYMYDRGWDVREIWAVLRHFWPQLPSQTPLASRTVWTWVLTRRKMRRRGLTWP